MFLDISEEQYHADRANFFTSHSLIDFSRCPFGYKRAKDNPKEHKSNAFTFGTAAHVLLLEGRSAFEERYIVSEGPINEKTGRAYGKETKKHLEWLAEQPLPIISFQEMGILETMNKSISNHYLANEAITDEGKHVEGVIRESYEGVQCQSKVDYFSENYGLMDLKTTQNIQWFENDCKKYGYFFQMAFYWHMLYLLTGKLYPVHIVAIEKEEPFRCGVYLVQERVLKQAHELNLKNMKFYKRCLADDNWPTLYEDVRTIESLF